MICYKCVSEEEKKSNKGVGGNFTSEEIEQEIEVAKTLGIVPGAKVRNKTLGGAYVAKEYEVESFITEAPIYGMVGKPYFIKLKDVTPKYHHSELEVVCCS